MDAVVNGKVTASIAEWQKTPKCQDLTVNYLFQLVAFETFGQAGLLTMKFLSMLATHLTKLSGDAHAGAWLLQGLNQTIAHGNVASMVLASVGSIKSCRV